MLNASDAYFIVTPASNTIAIFVFSTRTEGEITTELSELQVPGALVNLILGTPLACRCGMESLQNNIYNSLRGQHVPAAHSRRTRRR